MNWIGMKLSAEENDPREHTRGSVSFHVRPSGDYFAITLNGELARKLKAVLLIPRQFLLLIWTSLDLFMTGK